MLYGMVWPGSVTSGVGDPKISAPEKRNSVGGTQCGWYSGYGGW